MLERVRLLAETHPDLAGQALFALPVHDPRVLVPAGLSRAAGSPPTPGYELLGWWEAERRDLPWRRDAATRGRCSSAS